MNYGAAKYVLSAKLSNSLIHYELPNNFGYFYRKKKSKQLSNGAVNEYWLCIRCDKIREANGNENHEVYSTIIVSNNRILRDPNLGHHTNYVARNFGELNAQILDREARNECLRGRKRPFEAHTSMNSEVVRRFPEANLEASVEAHLPEYKTVKSALRRWSRKDRVPVEDPFLLPAEYQVYYKSGHLRKGRYCYSCGVLRCDRKHRKIRYCGRSSGGGWGVIQG